MTSATGTGPVMVPVLMTRRAPLPGEIGHPATCPLCTSGPRDMPPCLACRDEIRSRLVEVGYRALTLN